MRGPLLGRRVRRYWDTHTVEYPATVGVIEHIFNVDSVCWIVVRLEDNSFTEWMLHDCVEVD